MRAAVLYALFLVSTSAFAPVGTTRTTSSLFGKNKRPKGFGAPPEVVTKEVPSKDESDSTKQDSDVVNVKSESAVKLMNTGTMRLAELEAKKASQKINVLETAINLTEEDDVAREGGGVIPEEVASRMTGRMWGFVGVPFGGCLGLFAWFYYQAKFEGVRYEPMLVASGTVGLLVIGLLGITYSLLSASWDEEGESEGLGGVATFNDNVGKIKEGVGRGRANVKARDTLESIGGVDEINRMREDLAKKEAAELKRRQSFADKMKDEGVE